MTRFAFPLDRLLKVKRQLEKLAEAKLRRAQEARDAARAAAHELRERQAGVSAYMTDSLGRGFDPTRWAAASDLSEQIGTQIAAADAAVLAAAAEFDRAAAARTEAATEVEALTTLRRQQFEKWRDDAAKAAQEQLDEVGLRRWQAAKAAAAPEAT